MDRMRSPSFYTSLAFLVLCAGLGFAFGGCLIPSKPTECSTDDKCQEEYGFGSYCADGGICEQRTREEMLSDPCGFGTTGPAFQEGTRHIGVTLKMTEADSNTLIEPVKRAIDLAIEDINTTRGVDGHKYAAIYCDNEGKTDRAIRAAEHLADLGLEAMVGPGFSSHTLEAAPDAIVPNDIMMITPSATSPRISGIDDKNLVWRTAPSDVLQGKQLSKLVKHIQTEKENGNLLGVGGEDGTAKLGMSNRKESAYAKGLKNAVISDFSSEFLDGQNFFTATHPNPSRLDGDPDYSSIAQTISGEAPDVMMVWGVDEVWDVIWNALQAGRNSSSLGSTIFVTGDGAKRSAIAAQIAQDNQENNGETLKGRVWGTSPGTLAPDDYEPYKLFQFRWNNASFDGPDFGDASNHAFISYGYDAVYLFAFASAAANSFEGKAMADAMNRVTDPDSQKIMANQSDFQTGVTELNGGGSINFQGATGPLKFDENGDPKNATIELWCFQDAPVDDSGNSEEPQITSAGNLLKANSDEFHVQTCDLPDTSSNE